MLAAGQFYPRTCAPADVQAAAEADRDNYFFIDVQLSLIHIYRLDGHQYHHHLPGHHAAPQQAVAEQAGALVLIVRLVAAGAGPVSYTHLDVYKRQSR